ncbi:porphobilinogen synthase [Conexibacter sp. DBS9H8]|uniref:porphobilinogen synthase n=1 Tax=Conexibacter sp. DBS9H8 TaxID=2937801 RepID=UPI00200D2617|nr:porphobilinogen synthase [Conexibacter sp. DBS9H8]
MGFPQTRMRRLRATPALRALVAETRVQPGDLIAPLFISEVLSGAGAVIREPIATMPGIDRLSVEAAVEEAAEIARLGIGAVLLFGIPAEKDPEGSGAYDPDGIVQVATRAIKATLPDLTVVCDLCLCEYTDHGHCGVLRRGGDATVTVDNDATLELLARAAIAQAAAGVDIVAPSDMMDGRVGHLRRALDEEGFSATPIMAYSSKFASAFYGPFREAAGSAPSVGDRRGYQLDPANGAEALRESELDMAEGADLLMVKPALAYLDVISAVKARTGMPLVAYSVGGEYAMLKAAAAAGFLDERAAVLETLTAIRRAGADIIITYYAKEAARWL